MLAGGRTTRLPTANNQPTDASYFQANRRPGVDILAFRLLMIPYFIVQSHRYKITIYVSLDLGVRDRGQGTRVRVGYAIKAVTNEYVQFAHHGRERA